MSLNRHTRIDIPKVLGDLAYLLGDPDLANSDVRTAVSEYKLADALDVHRNTLRGWLAGSDPGLHHGLIIIGMWCELTGKAQTFIHRERAPLSAARSR